MDEGAEAREILRKGLDGLQLEAEDSQVEALLGYLALLGRWGKVYNLTAITEVRQAVRLHLLDSLAGSPYLPEGRILDVGTGAGLPGIPLAILHPDRQFVLLDRTAKKIRFIRQVVMGLELANVEVYVGRLESYRPDMSFDAVVTRAFANLGLFWRLASHLVSPGGRLLAWKGRLPEAELMALAEQNVSAVAHCLRIPDMAIERHLVALSSGGLDE